VKSNIFANAQKGIDLKRFFMNFISDFRVWIQSGTDKDTETTPRCSTKDNALLAE